MMPSLHCEPNAPFISFPSRCYLLNEANTLIEAINDLETIAKNRFKLLLVLLMMAIAFAGCGNSKEKKVTCPMCNGSGQVKYYYGEGDNEYNMGPCTSCYKKGYIMIVPSGDSKGGTRVICGSCGRYVDKLITNHDGAGESRTWCEECWLDYEQMMGQ